MPGPYDNLLPEEVYIRGGLSLDDIQNGSNQEYWKSGAAYNLKVARNPQLRTENRILTSEQDYQNAIDYYRAKAEEMQGRTAPEMDWAQANADREAYLADRGRQDSFSQQLLAQANGTGGPSVAEKQMEAGLAAGQQQSRAMAASARGGALAQAGANRLAMQQAGNMAGQVNQQAGTLRAQEQAQARGEYAQMLAQMQGQNAQQRGLSQGQTVAAAQNEAGQRQRNDQMAQGMYGAESGSRDALYSGRVSLRGQETGYAQSQNALDEQRRQNKQDRKDRGTSALISGLTTVGGAAVGFMAGGPAGAAAGGYAGNQMARSDVRSKTQIAPVVPGWDPNRWASTGSGVAPVEGEQPGMTQYQSAQLGSSLGGGLGQMASGLASMSDERCKNVGAAAGSPVAEQMREAPPYRYRYKDPADGTGERFGPMAQDLAQTESGRSVVVETPRGLAIDGQRAIPNLLAQTATLQKQLDEMRAKLGQKGGK